MSFPQLPFFSPLRLLPPSSATLVSANYAVLDNTTFARLVNRNYGAIASSSSLNDKILAYWNFQEKNLDGDFENQVNIADLPLAANGNDIVAGIIGNGLYGNGNNYGSNTDTRLDPQIARFLGVGGWVNANIDIGNLSSSQLYEDKIISKTGVSTGYNLTGRTTTYDPVDIDTITCSIYLRIDYDNTPIEIDIPSVTVGWNFFYFEINFAANEAKLSLNAGAFSTISFTEINTIATNFYVGGNTDSDIVPTIDEVFVCDEALDLADLAVIYNSGSANAYPF